MELNIIWDLNKRCDLELLVYRGASDDIRNYAWKLLKESTGTKIEKYIHVDSTNQIAEENWDKIKKTCADWSFYMLNGKTSKIREEAKQRYSEHCNVLKTIPEIRR